MRHIAIVGSGPAGYYTAEAAQKELGDEVRVDVFDCLPVPYGLIRTGVAPDHQSIKAVARRFEKTALCDNCRFVGNVTVGRMVAKIHDNVKEGGTLTEPLKASRIFPAMIGGMVDVGEQTGALPDMLLKIADDSDEQVDNSVTALTSLLEPVMIIFLALVVGSIVIAMFLPLISIIQDPGFGGGGGGDN